MATKDISKFPQPIKEEMNNHDIYVEIKNENETETNNSDDCDNPFGNVLIDIKHEISGLQSNSVNRGEGIQDLANPGAELMVETEEEPECIGIDNHHVNLPQVPTLQNERENRFQNYLAQLKHEINLETGVSDNFITPNLDPELNNQTTDDNMHTKIVISHACTVPQPKNMHIKEEIDTEKSLVTYDYPNFDAESIDSNEAEALGHVEACLDEDSNVKCEKESIYDINPTEVKSEPDLTITETQLTRNLINATIRDNPDLMIKYLAKRVTSNEEILSSYENSHTNHIHNSEMDFCPANNLEPFQLNSITGNVLSLTQQAYGMVESNSHNAKTIPCPKCPNMYRNKYGLKHHLKVHASIERFAEGRKKGLITRQKNAAAKSKVKFEYDKVIKHYKCPLCPYICKTRKTMKRHIDVGHQNKMEDNDGKNDLNESSCSQSKNEIYKCVCGKMFKRRSRMETCLRSHSFLKTNLKCATCVTCSKTFNSKTDLAMHRKRFHRKKFPCKFCPTDYDTRKELFKHLQVHQKVQLSEYKVISEVMKGKKLKCFMCSKSYIELSDLKTHVMNDHSGPFICPLCKNTFPKIIDFGNHTKTYHPDVEGQSVLDVLEAFSKLVKDWKCEECNIQFHEADKLALHQIEKHSPDMRTKQQFQCIDCRRVFVSQKGLTSHRRVHHSVETSEESKPIDNSIMCLECRKICKDMTALTLHMRLHSPDRKYPCKFCDFRFATPEKRKTHAEIHTGDMKYVCFICEYTCSSENRLKQHKMSLKHANMKEYLLTGKPLIEEQPTPSASKTEGKKKEFSAKKKKKDKVEEKKDRKSSGEPVVEIPCEICGEKFASESEMLEHKQTHPFIEFPNDDKPTRIFFK